MWADEAGRQQTARALLRTIVEQFVGRVGHRPDDVRQFETLVSDLIDLCDNESVAEIAESLCRHPETPAALIVKLFERGGASARIAFECAPEASHEETRANAEYGSADTAAAIARRGDLPRGTIAALVARGESVVHRTLAANRALRLDPALVRALTQLARDDVTLARVLLDRTELTIDPEPLFLAANEAERSRIVLSACRAALIMAPGEGSSETGFAQPIGAEFGAAVLTLAIEQKRDAMIARVADALDARKNRVRNIFDDAGGEALALTFVALAVDVDTATKIFLCGDWAFSRDEKKLRALRALMRSTPARAAARIVSAINGSGRPDRDAVRRPAREDWGAQATRRRASADRATSETPHRKADRSA